MLNLSFLFEKAVAVRCFAYAPYSGFAVGAAILAEDEKIYTGCNVENVSYPCGTCAEAGAIAAMNANGNRLIKDIVIVADASNLISPCGACLQRIAEFANQDTMIHLADLDGVKKSFSISELLPVSFDEEELRK